MKDEINNDLRKLHRLENELQILRETTYVKLVNYSKINTKYPIGTRFYFGNSCRNIYIIIDIKNNYFRTNINEPRYVTTALGGTKQWFIGESKFVEDVESGYLKILNEEEI